MPAVAAPEDFAAWLDPKERGPAKLLPLLTPYPAQRMGRRPVDRRKNSTKADEPGLRTSVELPARPPTLFDAAWGRFGRAGAGHFRQKLRLLLCGVGMTSAIARSSAGEAVTVSVAGW